MTPEALALIHAQCFTRPPPWTAKTFASFLTDPTTFLLTDADAFILGRVILDEAELLTLAVAPLAQGQGKGQRLVGQFLQTARQKGAVTAFLEVAEGNAPARQLYAKAGFTQTGCRKRYYAGVEDALLLSRPL
ncbi:ribosomal protein S18-alanine N-acetyltransferase [Neogemmobacter tilapiae]|uniref:[Ribosomal protein bS18]-alanine N-acetyltransferase n=1 Tax=Neogemmobacter tilapiae TaxID=875041 RepID=A0A918TN25_9RHOB|nr:ribosomal protein S18-alanine N-acetyltransferase [Gemmobacter tilapiae]GHC53404.1 alanine acetyltransferase [Gemmobacter tilapiae]